MLRTWGWIWVDFRRPLELIPYKGGKAAVQQYFGRNYRISPLDE